MKKPFLSLSFPHLFRATWVSSCSITGLKPVENLSNNQFLKTTVKKAARKTHELDI